MNTLDDQKVLYVDKMGYISYSHDEATIRHNCNTINETILGSAADTVFDSDGSTTWFPAGKYLCSVSISQTDREYTMLIIDIKNNDAAFYQFLDALANSPQIKQVRQGAIAAYNKLKSTYEMRKNDFRLKVGSLQSG